MSADAVDTGETQSNAIITARRQRRRTGRVERFPTVKCSPQGAHPEESVDPTRSTMNKDEYDYC
jgi:hypothetical protein